MMSRCNNLRRQPEIDSEVSPDDTDLPLYLPLVVSSPLSIYETPDNRLSTLSHDYVPLQTEHSNTSNSKPSPACRDQGRSENGLLQAPCHYDDVFSSIDRRVGSKSNERLVDAHQEQMSNVQNLPQPPPPPSWLISDDEYYDDGVSTLERADRPDRSNQRRVLSLIPETTPREVIEGRNRGRSLPEIPKYRIQTNKEVKILNRMSLSQRVELKLQETRDDCCVCRWTACKCAAFWMIVLIGLLASGGATYALYREFGIPKTNEYETVTLYGLVKYTGSFLGPGENNTKATFEKELTTVIKNSSSLKDYHRSTQILGVNDRENAFDFTINFDARLKGEKSPTSRLPDDEFSSLVKAKIQDKFDETNLNTKITCIKVLPDDHTIKDLSCG